MTRVLSIVALVLLLSVGVVYGESVVFEDDFTESSLSVWNLFVPGTISSEWEFHSEDGGFLRVPPGVDNATAEVELPTLEIGPTSDITKIIVEVDYRLKQYSDNGYLKVYLLNKDTRDGYGAHVYAGIMDWKFIFVAINRDQASELKVSGGFQADTSSDWITLKFVLDRSGSLALFRNGVQVAAGRIASGDLTGVPLGEFNQLVLVDRHNYAQYEFGRVKVAVERE